MISSPKNQTVRAAYRLHKPRHREKEGFFLAEGPSVLEAALRAGSAVRTVFHTVPAATRREALLKEAARAGAKLYAVAPPVMAYLAATDAGPDVLAIVALREAPPERIGAGPGILLAGVRDPRAVGAVLATAAAAGVGVVVAARGSADVYEGRAVRTARGAHFGLDVVRGVTASDAAARVRGAGGRLVALADEGPAPWEADLSAPFVLAVGSGAAGLTEDKVSVRGAAGEVPLAGQVAVALFEAARQRGGA